jgi:hypothetical protein
MPLKLNDEQRQALAAHPGTLLRLIDEQTQAVYVLLPAEQYERLRLQEEPPRAEDFVVAPGIRRSRAAFLRDLPGLLANPKLDRWWVAYHGDQRIGIARTKTELVLECVRRKLKSSEYHVGIIRPHAMQEEEELERSLYEFDEDEPSEEASCGS